MKKKRVQAKKTRSEYYKMLKKENLINDDENRPIHNDFAAFDVDECDDKNDEFADGDHEGDEDGRSRSNYVRIKTLEDDVSSDLAEFVDEKPSKKTQKYTNKRFDPLRKAAAEAKWKKKEARKEKEVFC